MNGDYYLNTNNGDVYAKSGGTWNLADNLTGPQGPQGIQGNAGATGATGPGVPNGGTTGQYLRKSSGTDQDTAWDTFTRTDITDLGAGVADWMGNPNAGNLRAAVSPASGTGELVFNTSPTLITPALGTPSAVDLANATNLPASSVVWSGAATQSPVLHNDVLLIEQATGGAKRRVIASDVAKSAVPYYGFVTVPVTGIGTTPVTIFTTSSLAPGTYILSMTCAFGVALSGGATSFTFDLALASGAVASIAGFAGKPGHTTTIGQQGSAGISALPFSLVTTFTNSNQNSLCVYSAVVVVSSTAVITVSASLNTSTAGFVRAGSFLQIAQ